MKRDKFLLPYEQVAEIISSIPVLRDKAFLCLTYACAGRIGEIVWGRVERTPPVSKENIEVFDDKIYVSILTEKVRLVRRVGISRINEGMKAKPPVEPGWLTFPIITYMDRIDDNYLFPYSTRWGQKIFEKYFGTQHIHLLRAWRQTHLLQGKVTEKPLPRQYVARMAGITNLSTLDKSYDLSTNEDYDHLI